MEDTSLREWLDSLKVGDVVGVFDLSGERFLHAQRVTKRTKKRIIIGGATVYRNDGWRHIRASSPYAGRRLGPVDQEEPKRKKGE